MNATATHDTKRGEDVRARLNVLTRCRRNGSGGWSEWMEWNAVAVRVSVNGVPAPAGVRGDPDLPDAAGRLAEPARGGGGPARPGQGVSGQGAAGGQAEQQLDRAAGGVRAGRAAIRGAHSGRQGRRSCPTFANFRRCWRGTARATAWASCCSRSPSPGVPDFYQGTELWQLHAGGSGQSPRRGSSPANRPAGRAAAAGGGRSRSADPGAGGNPQQDETKLCVTYKALEFRRAQPGPVLARRIPAAGGARHVRRPRVRVRAAAGQPTAVAVAPRWTSQVEDWADTHLTLPHRGPWQDVLTGVEARSDRIEDLLREFPVALLQG